MRRSSFLVGPALAGAVVVVSCGARTGLYAPEALDASTHHEAGFDATRDRTMDVTPPQDGRLLDVQPDCTAPSYCKPDDPNYLYKCGVRYFQCGSLEQCEERCADGGVAEAGTDAGNCPAKCVDPCLDTLGENTSNGCEFYAAEMDLTPEAVGVCYAVFIVNQWNTGEAAKLEVDLGGITQPIEQFARIPVGTGENIQYTAFDATKGLPQNEIAILFLSRDPAAAHSSFGPSSPSVLASCPPGITPAFVGDAALHGTGVGTAFHIKSNVPVVAYQMLPYGGGHARVTGATLLLPTNVWADNYVAANAYRLPTRISEPRVGPSMAILASQNDTHVTINPVTPIVGGPGIPPTGAGQPMTYTVEQGQYLQFTQPLELSGSAIQSDKPVAVIGASTLMDIPAGQTSRADHGEQMLPPVRALGSQYVAVRYRTRSPPIEEVVPWRIIGVANGTRLTYDPPQLGAPTQLAAQQLIEFDATGPFTVSSQDSAHPFYFAQYMTGGEPFEGEGDPEYVNVITPAQYLPRYTFFTDPTYPETNLVVVRTLDAASGVFPDVTLDCAGLLSGWAPVGSSGQYQFTRIDLSTGNFQGQNGCNNGVHRITGAFPNGAGGTGGSTPMFGVTVWGWGNPITDPNPDDATTSVPPASESDPNFTRWVSYGYPAGANITKLNDVVLSAQ